jgi:hypothetical protein
MASKKKESVSSGSILSENFRERGSLIQSEGKGFALAVLNANCESVFYLPPHGKIPRPDCRFCPFTLCS